MTSSDAPRWAGFALDRPRIMGVVNVTPDSFSDGGRFLAPEDAIAHARALIEEGADLLDVGGESTRPGATPVPVAEELERVVPVIRALAGLGVPISVDTRHARVMAAALQAGAAIVNDITALSADPDALGVVADARAPVVLMHMQGVPETMQRDPRYADVVSEVRAYLAERVAVCVRAGIPAERIAVDPGIGFGKTAAHNAALLASIDAFTDLAGPVLVGASRKSFIARISADEPADQRLAGSITAALAAVDGGARILRVHDVAQTRQALAIQAAIARERRGAGEA